MITEIGIVAGDIWHYLDEYGCSDFNEVITAIGASRKLAFMSLGWLAREGHVLVEEKNEVLQVSLRTLKEVE